MSTPDVGGVVDRVHRVLRYAVRDEGARLWALPYTERICRPQLERLLREELPVETADPLIRAFSALEGVDSLPWSERLAPLSEALAEIDAVAATLPPPGQLEAVGGLIELPNEAEEPARPAAPRERRAAPAVQATPQPAAPPPPAPPPPPTRLPLGAAGHTGVPVQSLPGVGSALAEALVAAGVVTVADLLVRVPVEHQRLTVRPPEEPLVDMDEDLALTGTVHAMCLRFSPMARVRELVLTHGEHTVRCRWLGALPEAAPAVGDEICVVGRVDLTEDGPVLYEPLRWTPDARGVVRRPVYAVPGVDDRDMHRLARQAVERYASELVDPLPASLLRDHRIPELGEALRELHLPTGSYRRSVARLAFEELYRYQLRAAANAPVRLRGIAHPISHDLVARLQIQHEIALTDAQEAVFDEIRRDLRRPVAMTRLLQGDVGSGKAIVALLAAVVVAESRSQVLFLAPDMLSAEHRFLFAEPLLRAAGLVPLLLGNEPAPAQLETLRRGDAHVIFAPQSFAEGGLPGLRKLGLVVAEERGSYGAIRRELLAQKGVHPDLLVVTAVPIPSSLTFTLFSDHDLSILSDPNQQIVETVVSGPDSREEGIGRVRASLESGRQALVVYPLVKGLDVVDLPRAQQLASALQAEAFPGFKVGLYHGSMPREDRLRVYDEFQRRKFDVLLSTTTIEDVPELPNVTSILVEGADRFDLVRLHRLRGLVGKGRGAGFCQFLLSAKPTVEGTRQVELVAREQDGFSIAEQDRIARGDEALLGARVSELPSFTVADPTRDRDLLLRARRAAFQALSKDPQLRQRGRPEPARRQQAEAAPAAEPAGPKGAKRKRRRRKGGPR